MENPPKNPPLVMLNEVDSGGLEWNVGENRFHATQGASMHCVYRLRLMKITVPLAGLTVDPVVAGSSPVGLAESLVRRSGAQGFPLL